MKKKKLKKYMVGVVDIDPDYDEFEVEAKNKTEARKKAEQKVDKNAEYFGMAVDSIDEVKDDRKS